MAASGTSFLIHRALHATNVKKADNNIFALKHVHQVEDTSDLSKFRTYRLITSAEEKELKQNSSQEAGLRLQKPAQEIIGEQKDMEGYSIAASEISRSNPKKIFLSLGCQGEGNKTQKEVAAMMNKVVKQLQKQGYEVMCVLVLGDNVYNSGADSPDDKKFNECCDNIYANESVPDLAKIPFFYIQGNHDQNRHSARLPGSDHGVEVGLMEVARTYMPAGSDLRVEDRIVRYNKKINPDDRDYYLVKEQLTHYNMPARTYSLIIDDVQIFCIDSNTFVKDYLDYKFRRKTGTQAEWLELKMNEARNTKRKPIIALHHPPFTLGNRAYGHDVHLYLDKEDEQFAREKLGAFLDPNDKSYNALIKATLRDLGELDIFAAHDHSIYKYNNKKNTHDTDQKVCQIVSAGGGGKLQNQYYFEKNENIAAFLDSYGFVVTESDEEKLNFAVYTNDTALSADFPLMFTNKSCEPVRHFPSEADKARIHKYRLASDEALGTYSHPANSDEYQKVFNLTRAVKLAIDDFMKFIAEKHKKHGHNFLTFKNFTHDHAEIQRAHRLLAYISRPWISSFDVTMISIVDIAGVSSSGSDNSLSTYLIKWYGNCFDNRILIQDFYQSRERLLSRREQRQEEPSACAVM